MELRRVQFASAVTDEKDKREEGKEYPLLHRLLGQTKYKVHLPLALALVFLLAALIGYGGRQASKLGPPLGSILGQDARQVLRATRDLEAGNNPYLRAQEFGRSPDFKEFMTWNAAPYPYPPLVAVLARPLLRLATDDALRLWTGANLVLVVLSALVAVFSFTGARGLGRATRLALILTLFFVYAPIQIDLKLVQLDILILFLLLFTYYLYRHGSDWAGVPLGLAMAVKPIVAPLLFFFLWKRHWRLSAVTVVTAATLIILGFSAAGWAHLPAYMEVNRLWATGGILVFPFNQSVRGFALRLFTPNIYNEPLLVLPWLAYLLPVLVGALAVGGWLVIVSRADNRKEVVNGIEYGLTLTTALFLSPLVDDIHFVWALMPLAALLLATLDGAKGAKGLVLLAACFLLALYLSSPLLHAAIYAGSAALLEQNRLVAQSKVLYTGAYLYGLIALHVWLMLYLFIRRTHSKETRLQ